MFRILNQKEFKDIIHWDNEGTAIVVKRVLQFESIILPKYFDSSRMDSFSRQLNVTNWNLYKLLILIIRFMDLNVSQILVNKSLALAIALALFITLTSLKVVLICSRWYVVPRT